jgi:tetratricopeptide (TPR) repeat protein
LQLSLTKRQQMNWISKFYFYDRLKKSGFICCITIIICFASFKLYSQSPSNQLVHQTVLQIKEDSNTIRALIDSSQRIILLDSTRAMRLAERSLSIAKKLEDNNNIVRGYCQVANVYSLYLQPDSALYYYKKSIDISLKEGFLSKLPALYVNVANVHDNQGLFKKSVEYYNKALVICQQLKNRRKQAGILSAMGLLFLKNNQYKENIVYQANAIKIYEEIENKPGILYGLSSMASGYIALYKSTKSHPPYLDSALSSCKNGFVLLGDKIDLEGNHHLIPSLYYTKAEILFLKNDYPKAMELVKEAIQKLSLVNDKKILCNSHLLLGHIYSATKNFAFADKEGLSALQLAEEVDDPSLLNDCYQQLSLQQLQKGDTSK